MTQINAGVPENLKTQNRTGKITEALPRWRYVAPTAPAIAYSPELISDDAAGPFTVERMDLGTALNYQSRAGVLNLMESVVEDPESTGYVKIEKAYSFGPNKYVLVISTGERAIPNDLIESELFGVQKGAYTGALASRPGKFERADGGTLFLDELGELSPAAQVKLLRVLQTGEVERLGDDKLRKVNVRLVAATNVNLQQAIADGRFRADLYYRLATYPLEIPPLRMRKSDIPVLASVLTEKYAPLYHKAIQGISELAMQGLMAYDWPGNVRELENLVERAVLLVPSGGQIEVEHLFPGMAPVTALGAVIDRAGKVGSADEAKKDQLYEALLEDGFDLQAHEARLLRLAVARSNGNLTHAARLLGITRRQLAYRVKQTLGEEGTGRLMPDKNVQC